MTPGIDDCDIFGSVSSASEKASPRCLIQFCWPPGLNAVCKLFREPAAISSSFKNLPRYDTSSLMLAMPVTWRTAEF